MYVDTFIQGYILGGFETFIDCNNNFFRSQIGINPGLLSAFKGRHYPNPGNHFCELDTISTVAC